jgi:lipopolysaccharide biosynthesis glycosyltransferase
VIESAAQARREGAPAIGPIVLACDGSYAMQLATTLRSLVEANRRAWPLDVHVFAEDVCERDRRRVLGSLPRGSASIRWVEADLEAYRGFTTPEWISKATFARLLIPAAFEDTVARVLYLDADILVLDDLAPLWETDLDGAVVAAVLDRVDPQLKAGAAGLDGLPRVQDYFNAGVLLIDLHQWRRERITERALAYSASHPDSPYSDQDALNVVCDRRWKRLPRRWNFQDHFDTRISAMPPERRPAIVHFISGFKPWKASSVSLNAALYDGYRARTRYARGLRERLRDVLAGAWYRAKPVLRRSTLLTTAWSRVKSWRSRSS